MRPTVLVAIAGAIAGLGIAGCHQQSGSGHLALGADSAATDSATGVVRTVGVSATSDLSLVLDDGTALGLRGSHLLGRVSGLLVVVRGSRAANSFTVRTFEVREAQGASASDGLLSASGERYTLTTADGGTVVVSSPPQGLKGMTGHRVWIARASNGRVISYGLID
jgi:hypothetical protein